MRVLDVGFGTGIWAMDMKRLYPHAEVIAIDISDGPPAVDVNGMPMDYDGVDFRSGVDFTRNDGWGFDSGSFDFIYCSMLCGSVPDWQAFAHNVTRLLKPMTGQAEFLELDYTPRSDIEEPAAGSEVQRWWHAMRIASHSFGKPLAYPDHLDAMLHYAGCNVISHKIVEIRTAEDLRCRDAGDPQNEITRWYRLWMFDPPLKTVKGMSLMLLTRQLGWTAQDVATLALNVNNVLNSNRSPYYHNL
ncbi:hypothetical protein LTR53_004744 [Teratosphaeriaceae sp. CCFEE 6253]|nr:hypothetical protein LTR53_004744 [Teratosphaeriaceae sp. CCFEE 6253]